MLLVFLAAVALGKNINSYVILTDSEPWQALTNFGLDVGTGNYTFKARLSIPLQNRDYSPSVSLALYLGVEWDENLLSLSCNDRVQKAKKVFKIPLNGNGEWSVPIEGKLTQKRRPHVWYFVLADCDRVLGNKKIKYEFSIVNPELSHFSVEMQGLKNVYGFLIALLIFGLGRNVYKLIKFLKNEEEVQGPVIWVNISIFFQILSVIFYYIHLLAYESNGEGISVFEFFGEAFTIISNLSITSLLILIAGGWTLTYNEFPIPELYIPAIFLLTFAHLFMAGFNFLHEQEKYSFTRYEGTSGLVITLIRIILYAWFIYNLNNTSKSREFKRNNFVLRFGLGSSLYFLSVPLLVIGSGIFPPHMREKIMVIGANFTQAGAFYFLYMIFTGRGDYYKLSSVINMLPGARQHTY